MAAKEFNTRVTHKHDTEAHWALAENFSPLQGEIIIYDEDDNNLSKRFKIGDGETNVNALPFISAGGIYVGSGPMPDGYDIQIDPNGEVDTGANGKSAYEIALEHGFEGTEEEWLMSLVGKEVELIASGELTEAKSEINIAQDNSGNPFVLYDTVEIYMVIPIAENDENNRLSVSFNGSNVVSGQVINAISIEEERAIRMVWRYGINGWYWFGGVTRSDNIYASMLIQIKEQSNTSERTIHAIKLYRFTGDLMPVGTRYYVGGRRIS